MSFLSDAKKVVIIGTSSCAPCKRSRNLVESFIYDRRPDLVLKSYNIDTGDISKEDAFKMAGGSFTNVPVIIVDGVNIGDYENLRAAIMTEVAKDRKQ